MKIKNFIFFFIISILPALPFIFFNTPFEFFFLDAKFILSNIFYNTYDMSNHIVIVLIDEYSEKKLSIPIEGKEWRYYDNELISLLNQHNASVIAFDIEYSGENTQWDETLALQYSNAGNVIICEIHEGISHPLLANNAYSTGNASVKTLFGFPRKIILYPDNTRQKAFSYEAVSAYLDFHPDSGDIFSDKEKNRLKNSKIKNEYWINFKYPVFYFPVFSYVDLINSKVDRIGNREKTPLSIFKNKIVLIAKDSQIDKISLPNNFGTRTFGGLVQAYGMETLLDGSQLHKPPLFMEFINLFLLIFIVNLISAKTSRVIKNFLIIFICVSVFIIQFIVFQTTNIWVLYAPFLISAVSSGVIHGVYKRFTLTKEFQEINIQVKRLAQFNTQLEEMGKLKDILTDTLVHDIKNAIAAIEGSLFFITEKYKDDSQSLEIFHAASIACTDIISLSSNLLDVRKIEEGKIELFKEPCSVDQMQAIIERFTYYPLFYEKKITVIIKPPAESFLISVDTYLLEQIFHNLLNNALKYTPQNGIIEISFKHEKNHNLIITFFNSGKPISEEMKHTIFEKYKRGKKKRSKYSKGLGLYFCKMAMEMHNGRIWLNTDKKGNYFRLEFPETV